MAEENTFKEMSDDVFWKKLVVRYWYFALIFFLIILGAIAGYLLVLNWYVDVRSLNLDVNLGETGLIEAFTPRTALLFCIYFILWEFLLVVLPGFVLAGAWFALMWFVILKDDEKEECRIRSEKDDERKKKRRKAGRNSGKSGGGFEVLVFIGVLIKLAVDGNWKTPLGASAMSIGYLADSWIIVTLWVLLIIGVPALIVAIIWFWKKFGTD